LTSSYSGCACYPVDPRSRSGHRASSTGLKRRHLLTNAASAALDTVSREWLRSGGTADRPR
jgi:hypothetical protein